MTATARDFECRELVGGVDAGYSSSDELMHATRDATAPTPQRIPWKVCAAAAAACTAACGVLILVCFFGAKMIERRIVLHNSNGGATLCMDSGFTAAITAQLSEACTRLNRAGVQYWLDEGTLLGAIREQGVFKHDYDGDIAYVRGNHAELVGALHGISRGTFYCQADFVSENRAFPRETASRPPSEWKFMVDLYPFAEEAAPLRAERAGSNAGAAEAIGDAEARREESHLAFECDTFSGARTTCRCRRWAVFPLRALNGSGPLAHCKIPNMPWLYYEQREKPPHSSDAYWQRLLEAALDRRDSDFRSCVPRSREQVRCSFLLFASIL
jgi:hypothetical protein